MGGGAGPAVVSRPPPDQGEVSLRRVVGPGAGPTVIVTGTPAAAERIASAWGWSNVLGSLGSTPAIRPVPSSGTTTLWMSPLICAPRLLSPSMMLVRETRSLYENGVSPRTTAIGWPGLATRSAIGCGTGSASTQHRRSRALSGSAVSPGHPGAPGC